MIPYTCGISVGYKLVLIKRERREKREKRKEQAPILQPGYSITHKIV
jgi:hypothetical protein